MVYPDKPENEEEQGMEAPASGASRTDPIDLAEAFVRDALTHDDWEARYFNDAEDSFVIERGVPYVRARFLDTPLPYLDACKIEALLDAEIRGGTPMAGPPPSPDSPFRKVVDDLTDGCGCACHTGTGYRTSCEHCAGGAPLSHPDDWETILAALSHPAPWDKGDPRCPGCRADAAVARLRARLTTMERDRDDWRKRTNAEFSENEALRARLTETEQQLQDAEQRLRYQHQQESILHTAFAKATRQRDVAVSERERNHDLYADMCEQRDTWKERHHAAEARLAEQADALASRIDYGVTEAAMVKAERAMVIVEAALIEALAALGAKPL